MIGSYRVKLVPREIQCIYIVAILKNFWKKTYQSSIPLLKLKRARLVRITICRLITLNSCPSQYSSIDKILERYKQFKVTIIMRS